MSLRNISLERDQTHQHNFLKTCRKPLIIALEIIFGAACVGVSLYVGHLFGVGTLGLIGIGGGGTLGVLAIAIASILCLRKKTNASTLPHAPSPVFTKEQSNLGQPVIRPQVKSTEVDEQSKEVATEPTQKSKKKESSQDKSSSVKHKAVEGKIAIGNYFSAGALGKDLSCLFSSTKKVKRLDAKDWTQYPNEMLIECKVFNVLNKKSPLKEKGSLFLPFCLFIKNDDYTQWKEKGDEVEFIYEGYHYKLKIAQEESDLPMVWEDAVSLCAHSFYDRCKGHSILPIKRGVEGDQETYLNPVDIQRRQNKLKETEILKQKFHKTFSVECTLNHPIEPAYKLSQHGLVCELPGVNPNEIRYFFTDHVCAIYAPKRELFPEALMGFKGLSVNSQDFPELCPTEYLLILQLNATITRECIENGIKTTTLGVLKIDFVAHDS